MALEPDASPAPAEQADARTAESHHEDPEARSGTRERASRRATGDRRDRLVAAALLTLLGAAFLVVCAPDITAPFGHSDEGLNAAVWGYGSRSYRELGPLESALGGRRMDQRAYATHPPGLLTETAVAEATLGEHRWATRAPSWVGSLAVIALLYLLLRALELDRRLATAATVATLGTAMFFTYGWMLDTPVTSLPFGVAAALVWQRARHHAPGSALLAVTIAGLCGLSGWEATMFVVVLGIWSLADRSLEPTMRRRGGLFLAGASGGFLLSMGWGLWVYGDFSKLRDKLLLRSVGEASGLLDVLSYQGRWVGILLGIGVIGLVGSFLALRDVRFRPLAAVSLVTVFGYMLIFRGAAGSHPFWNYWLLLPTALGYAYLATWLDARRNGHAGGPVLAFSVAIAALGIIFPGAAKENIAAGRDAVHALRGAAIPESQTDLRYVGDIALPEDWMLYEFGLVGRPVSDADALRRWGNDHPEEVMLVVGPCPETSGVCRALWPRATGIGDYRAIRGRDAAAALAG